MNEPKDFLHIVKQSRIRFQNGEVNGRGLLGLGEISDLDIANTAAVMKASCPSAAMEEVVQCLFQNVIDCPTGVRLDILQMICRISPTLQAGLLARSHKFIDKTMYVRFLLAATSANTIVDPFTFTDFKQIVGVTNFITGSFIPTDTAFNISALMLKYGQIAAPVGANITDCVNVQYGLLETTNTAAGATAVNVSRVLCPQVIVNGECTLKFGSTNILQDEPMSFMNNYDSQNRSIGYKRIDNMFLCEKALKFSFGIKFGVNFVPPIVAAVQQASFLELSLIGAQVIQV